MCTSVYYTKESRGTPKKVMCSTNIENRENKRKNRKAHENVDQGLKGMEEMVKRLRQNLQVDNLI